MKLCPKNGYRIYESTYDSLPKAMLFVKPAPSKNGTYLFRTLDTQHREWNPHGALDDKTVIAMGWRPYKGKIQAEWFK